MSILLDDFATTGLSASTTRLGALLPLAPGTCCAIYFAWRDVTPANIFQCRAHISTEVRVADYFAGALFCTLTAGL